MNWIKIISINFIVFIFLLCVGEVGVRSFWTLKTCFINNCDYSRLFSLQVRESHSISLGLSEYDSNLGYVPRANFSGVINAPGWNSVKVSINEKGFRRNGDVDSFLKLNVLVFGDSFTFGDQVSDRYTWPACLQRKSKTAVANAGVFGYGAAQALRRAQYELKRNQYKILVFSIFVQDDFDRDRLAYVSGFPRPSLVKEGMGLKWSSVSDRNKLGTKYSPSKPLPFAQLYKYSLFFALMYEALGLNHNISGSNLTSVHPHAADINEIISWTLTEFSKIEGVDKLLVLQYGENLNDKLVLTRRRKTLEQAKILGLEVLDTYDILKKFNPKLIWNGHHTAVGNELVCDAVYKNLFN